MRGRRRGGGDGPSGLLLVDKPIDVTSAGVVARVRRVLGGVKAGHAGTLDPFATGLLPLCLGEGTKLAGYLTDSDKTYEGVIRLGVRSDTLDITGNVEAGGPLPALDQARLDALAAEHTGEVLQVPPAFSAIKVGGRPMYELARRGLAPQLQPRPVRVDRLELTALEDRRLEITIDCSKGFYVRSLARDIGEALGCGAVLESLRRTRVGALRVDAAIPLSRIMDEDGRPEAEAAIVPLIEAAAHLRLVRIAPADAADLRLGRQHPLSRLGPAFAAGERIRIAAGSDLVAVAVAQGKLWTLERVFAAPRAAAS
ncbi:MAG TPA: tRNA pseudouridine(55) synthase TruB [Candidatus Limnocylindrales bacterium]|nr:tRNA pseudouridine(55) synthase TruB [Candidatus Limnocylindrales bacterium]